MERHLNYINYAVSVLIARLGGGDSTIQGGHYSDTEYWDETPSGYETPSSGDDSRDANQVEVTDSPLRDDDAARADALVNSNPYLVNGVVEEDPYMIRYDIGQLDGEYDGAGVEIGDLMGGAVTDVLATQYVVPTIGGSAITEAPSNIVFNETLDAHFKSLLRP